MPSVFCGETSLFGMRVAFESSHPEALHTAISVLKWNNAASNSSAQSVTIVLVADEVNPPGADRLRIEGSRLVVARDRILLEADGERGRGSCRFPLAAMGSEAFDEAITTTVLFLVAQAGRTPVHASAVIVGGRAVVLAGRSGSGKSALAMAANRAGLPVLSEDSVFVQREPSFCVWGLGGAIHLLDKDALAGFGGGTRLRAGRLKRAVPMTLHQCKADDAVLCVLAPGERVTLEGLDPEDAVQELTEAPEPGYEFYGSRMKDAIRAIANRGCWWLTLSKDPSSAIATLIGAFSGGANRG